MTSTVMTKIEMTWMPDIVINSCSFVCRWSRLWRKQWLRSLSTKTAATSLLCAVSTLFFFSLHTQTHTHTRIVSFSSSLCLSLALSPSHARTCTHTHTHTHTLVEVRSRWLGAAFPSRTLLDVTVPLTMLLHQWKVNNHSGANGNQFQRQAVQNPGFLSPRRSLCVCVRACMCVCVCVSLWWSEIEGLPLLTGWLSLQAGCESQLPRWSGNRV